MSSRLRRFTVAGTLTVLLSTMTGPAAHSEGSGGAPVLDIVAPVLDITLPTSDLQGTARVDEAPNKVTVTLSSEVLFAKDRAKLRGQVRARLAEVAQTLKQRGPGNLAIVGYTDDLGSSQHGLVLSRQRAQAVRHGVQPLLGSGYTYTVTGKGEANPAVPNTSEANRRQNRRVVVTFTPSG